MQNPVALQLRDGSVALYYVGLSCHISSTGYSSRDCEDSANSSLGVAHAPSPYGPWTRSDSSILSAARPITYEGDALANPAVLQQDDGRCVCVCVCVENERQRSGRKLLVPRSVVVYKGEPSKACTW